MRSLATDVLLGVAAGAAATWLMDLATTALYDRQPDDVQKRENDARGGMTAYERAADRAAEWIGGDLDEDQRKQYGSAIHWTLGVASGAIYGALRHAFPSMRYGSGLAYGTGFWLAMDEGANTLLGLTPSPQEFPWQTHARGLAGHLILGGAIEVVFDAADLVSSSSRA